MTAAAGARARGTFWALLPVGLLALSSAGVGSMAFIAANDPGFSLERDYYDRAVHWDREQAQKQENQRLGYRLALEVAADGALVARFNDREGQKVPGASVRAEGFANARAGDIKKLAFTEADDGAYHARIDSPRPGLWEFRFQVEHAGRRFTDVVRADVFAEAAPR